MYCIADSVIQPLKFLFNLSVLNGICPAALKIAKIIPIFKKGTHTCSDNYRPISILNTISKIFESIVAKKLSSFFNKYDIIYKYQFGFRKHYSTNMALINAIDEILTALNDNNYVAALYLDLSRAFDSLDRKILLLKLENYGIRGCMLNWLRSYLISRRQYVEIDGIKSDIMEINYGVPQGSVLGPLLFLIYINDVGCIDELINVPKVYADDTNLFINAPTIPELNVKCQNAINKIALWMSANRLTINLEKTFYMIFNPHFLARDTENLKLSLNNVPILRVSNIKFLGVVIDERLEWKNHILDLCNSLKCYVGIFYRISQKVPVHILKSLYFALVHSKVSYAIQVYANTYSAYLHDLEVLNNRLLRMLQHRPLATNTANLYKFYNTLPISKLFRFQFLMLAHRIIFLPETVPLAISDGILFNSDIHTYNTRASKDFHRTTSTSSFSNKLSGNIMAKLWNGLPFELKSVTSEHILKKTKILSL